MSQQKVLEYLKEKGEVIYKDMQVEGVERKALSGILKRLYDAGLIVRKEVREQNRKYLLYSAGPESVEPDYSKILRNLPRNVNGESYVSER
jgi:DNA-binding MarR family transcriptional regulator